MNSFRIIFFLFIFLLEGFGFFVPQGNAADLPDSGLQWGQSMREVIAGQHIDSYMESDGVSLLSRESSRAIFTESSFLGNKCSIVYSFKDDRLIEYYIHIMADCDEDTLYREIKTFLSSTYIRYSGDFFKEIDDRFMDASQKTCVLLVRDEDVIIYLLDFQQYLDRGKKRFVQTKEDLTRLIVK